MENPFDRLAKTLAEEVPRREAIRRLGGGLAGALLASLGLERAWGQGNSVCAGWCVANFPPGPARDTCKSSAAHGGGPCYDCGPAGDNRGLCPGGGQGGVCCAVGAPCCNGACCVVGQTCCPSPSGTPYCTTLGSNSDCAFCGDVCPPEQPTCCGTTCVNTATDLNNCGACGNVCLGGQLPACCAGGCTDLATDDFNCGFCGHRCDPAHSEVCTGGVCT
jgi:hypothetical protein